MLSATRRHVGEAVLGSGTEARAGRVRFLKLLLKGPDPKVPDQATAALVLWALSAGLLFAGGTLAVDMDPWNEYADWASIAWGASGASLAGAGAMIVWLWRAKHKLGRPWRAMIAATVLSSVWLPTALLFAFTCRVALPEVLAGSAEAALQRTAPGIEVSPDGATIAMRMEFKHGVTKRVKDLLRTNPGVRTVELYGPGGSKREGIALARLIRARGLDTLVQAKCNSACGIAFLAGRRRMLRATAGPQYVGLHPPFLETKGLTGPTYEPIDTAETDEDIRTSGASEAFIRRVDATSIYDVWKPSPAEFSAGGVPVVLLGDYELPGWNWGKWAPSPEESREYLGLDEEAIDEFRRGDPDVASGTLAWIAKARAAARNEMAISRHVQAATGRVLALRISGASDADVRKAGLYVRAAMVEARDRSKGTCARLGASPDLRRASLWVRWPPDSASDPSSPYGGLLRRVYAGATHHGWPGGIGLPDPDAAGTWAVNGPPPRPAASCDAYLAWYAWATDIDNPDGPFALRARFASFAGVPVGLDEGGSGRGVVAALSSGNPALPGVAGR